MKLRWFSVCDKDGVKTHPELQFWCEEIERWESVKYVECKVSQYEDYMQSKNS